MNVSFSEDKIFVQRVEKNCVDWFLILDSEDNFEA